MDSVTGRTNFAVGEEATFNKTFTQSDVQLFSTLCGDTNPLHLDETYAQATRFGGPIIHGMLVVSLISTALGTLLPGPGCVYVSQQVSFRAPGRVNERLTSRVRVIEWDSNRGRITLATEVFNERNEQLITGEAKMILSSYLR